MKCFDEREIKAIKAALRYELRKNKKLSTLEDSILEKVEYFKCPKETVSIDEITKLPLSERINMRK